MAKNPFSKIISTKAAEATGVQDSAALRTRTGEVSGRDADHDADERTGRGGAHTATADPAARDENPGHHGSHLAGDDALANAGAADRDKLAELGPSGATNVEESSKGHESSTTTRTLADVRHPDGLDQVDRTGLANALKDDGDREGGVFAAAAGNPRDRLDVHGSSSGHVKESLIGLGAGEISPTSHDTPVSAAAAPGTAEADTAFFKGVAAVAAIAGAAGALPVAATLGASAAVFEAARAIDDATGGHLQAVGDDPLDQAKKVDIFLDAIQKGQLDQRLGQSVDPTLNPNGQTTFFLARDGQSVEPSDEHPDGRQFINPRDVNPDDPEGGRPSEAEVRFRNALDKQLHIGPGFQNPGDVDPADGDGSGTHAVDDGTLAANSGVRGEETKVGNPGTADHPVGSAGTIHQGPQSAFGGTGGEPGAEPQFDTNTGPAGARAHTDGPETVDFGSNRPLVGLGHGGTDTDDGGDSPGTEPVGVALSHSDLPDHFTPPDE